MVSSWSISSNLQMKSSQSFNHTEMKANGQFLQNAGLSASKVYMITEPNFKKLITTKKEGEYLNFVNKRYK